MKEDWLGLQEAADPVLYHTVIDNLQLLRSPCNRTGGRLTMTELRQLLRERSG